MYGKGFGRNRLWPDPNPKIIIIRIRDAHAEA
jgi:hypothetical protein